MKKLYRIYSFTCTWYEFLAYDSLKLIFLWLLMFRWAMWSKGLLLLQCYLINLIAVLTLHIAIIQYCFYFRQCYCSEIVSFFVPKYHCIKKFLCLILKYRICTQQIIEIWLSILLSMLHKTVILLSSLYRLIPSHRRYNIHKVALPSRFALLYLSIVMQNRHQQFNLVVGKSSNEIGNLRQINLLFRLSWIRFFFFFCYLHMFTIHRQHYVQPRNSSDVIAVVA